MSYTLLCETALQKTQWETGRGLIALTLADSGQRQHIRTAVEALLPHTIHFCCCDTQRRHWTTWQKCWTTLVSRLSMFWFVETLRWVFITVLLKQCAYGLVTFRQRNKLVRVRKRSSFDPAGSIQWNFSRQIKTWFSAANFLKHLVKNIPKQNMITVLSSYHTTAISSWQESPLIYQKQECGMTCFVETFPWDVQIQPTGLRKRTMQTFHSADWNIIQELKRKAKTGSSLFFCFCAIS